MYIHHIRIRSEGQNVGEHGEKLGNWNGKN